MPPSAPTAMLFPHPAVAASAGRGALARRCSPRVLGLGEWQEKAVPRAEVALHGIIQPFS
jgi:hypothetical protein